MRKILIADDADLRRFFKDEDAIPERINTVVADLEKEDFLGEVLLLRGCRFKRTFFFLR